MPPKPLMPSWMGRGVKPSFAFVLDMVRCPFCQQGPLRIIAAITQGEVIRKLLCHFKLTVDPLPIAPARVRQETFTWSST